VALLKNNDTIYQLSYDTLRFDQSYLIDMERNYQMSMKGNKHYYNLVSRQQAELESGICLFMGSEIAQFEIIALDKAGNQSRGSVTLRRTDMAERKPEPIKLGKLLEKYGTKSDGRITAFFPAGKELYALSADTMRARKRTFDLSIEDSVESNGSSGRG